jgi:hypothetical protein
MAVLRFNRFHEKNAFSEFFSKNLSGIDKCCQLRGVLTEVKLNGNDWFWTEI